MLKDKYAPSAGFLTRSFSDIAEGSRLSAALNKGEVPMSAWELPAIIQKRVHIFSRWSWHKKHSLYFFGKWCLSRSVVRPKCRRRIRLPHPPCRGESPWRGAYSKLWKKGSKKGYISGWWDSAGERKEEIPSRVPMERQGGWDVLPPFDACVAELYSHR